MTRATTTTRATVRAYHQARFRGDIPAAVRTLAEPFHFQSPLLLPTAHTTTSAGWTRSWGS
ncbi:hypothetical protein [Streptomyces anthocyanicus]|uniref:hypothetical protein n=1 Tax=Streptomyces anthocyanicus TaxID=68174 RepID=UPI00386E092D